MDEILNTKEVAELLKSDKRTVSGGQKTANILRGYAENMADTGFLINKNYYGIFLMIEFSCVFKYIKIHKRI